MGLLHVDAQAQAQLSKPYNFRGRPCYTYEYVSKVLRDNYGETLRGQGLHKEGRMAELWVNETKPSWSIITIFPDGVACLMASGSDWYVITHKHKRPMGPEALSR